MPPRLATLRVLAPLPTKSKTALSDGFKILVRAKYFGGICHLASQLAPLPTKSKTALSDGFKILVRAKGLEPSTSTLARLRSSQLSYARDCPHILTHQNPFCKQKIFFRQTLNSTHILTHQIGRNRPIQINFWFPTTRCFIPHFSIFYQIGQHFTQQRIFRILF